MARAKITAAKAATKAKGEGAGRPRVNISATDLKKAAKMKKAGSTWQEIRDELGVKTSSGRFRELWEERKAPSKSGKKGKKGKKNKAASPS